MYIDNYKKIFQGALFLLFFGGYTVSAQDFTPLVQRAWKNDAQLQAKYAQEEGARYSYHESKKLYYPNAGVNVQYTLAAGGRSIDLPVGDLLNPVYSALNGLTMSNQFPTIPNVQEQFLPNNFYDAKVRIQQPIFQPEINVLQEARQTALDMKGLEIKAHKRKLSREVMVAYFQRESARQVMAIYESADTLVQEARRVTKSLIKNGTSLPSALHRVEAQQAQINASKIESSAQFNNAERVLSFWIGEEPSGYIEMPELPVQDIIQKNEREELTQLTLGTKMQNLALKKEDQFYKPKIGAQLDLGSQAFQFGFEPYALFGLNMEWNFFDAGKHKNRKSSIIAESRAMAMQIDFVEKQLDLQTDITKENLEAAIQQALTFKERIDANERLYAEVFKKYKEGAANYIELLDAQTQVTQIQLQYSLARQNAWVKWADHVYAAASFQID